MNRVFHDPAHARRRSRPGACWARLIPALLLAAPLAAQESPRRDTVPGDSIYLLPDIIVTATRAGGMARGESPVAASAVTITPAARAAGRVTADLLRDMAGVAVQQTSAGQGAVILRGFVGNQVLLLVNGIPLNNGTYRDGPGQYLATIDPETIERIEVVRGPASVLYGSDAQGGVVNLITRPHPPAPDWTLRGTFQASQANRGARGRLSTGYEGEAVTVGAGITLLEAGDLRAGGGLGTQNPTGFSAEGADLRVHVRPAPQHAVTVGLEHFAMHGVPRYDRYVEFRAPAPGPDVEHVFDPQARQLVYARYDVTPHRPAVVDLQVTASLSIQREGRTRQRLDAGGVPSREREFTRDDVYTPGLSVLGSSMLHVGRQSLLLTWGGDAYRDILSAKGRIEDLVAGTATDLVRQTAGGPVPSGRFPDNATMDRVGLFLAADVPVTRWLRLSAGGRWSGFRTQADVGTAFGGAVVNRASALTGQVGVVARAIRPLTFAVRLAQGFRAPNLYDLTNVGPAPGGIVLPNPTARPEESFSYEASVRWTDRRTAVDVTVYRTEIDNFIDRAPGSFAGDTLFNGERVFQGLNVATARVSGVEIEAARAFGPLETRATVLYTRGEQRPAGSADEPMAKIPPLRGTATLRWHTLQRRVTVAYQLDWARRQDRLSPRDLVDPRIPTGGTPGYAIHGFIVTAHVSDVLTASAGLENLGDALYRPHASGVDAPGRHAWVGITLFQEF